jgi:hypothetical protein
MPPTWRPMHTAPRSVARVWLNHMTLGPILVEGRPGRWYAPSAARQVWRWYRPAEPDALEPFSGWLPYEALAVKETGTGRRWTIDCAAFPNLCTSQGRKSGPSFAG